MTASRKIFAGARIRLLRQGLNLTQAEFAQQIGISTSYLNQIENNQRALSGSVILALVDTFNFDLSELALDGAGKVSVDLQEVLTDPIFSDNKVLTQEIKVAATNAPNVTKAFLDLYRMFQKSREQLGEVDNALKDREASLAPLPYEEVRDYFHYNDNYIDSLDRAAESFATSLPHSDAGRHTDIADYLRQKHDVRVVLRKDKPSSGTVRTYDPATKTIYLNAASTMATNLFQLAYQVGLLEQGNLIEQLLDDAGFHTDVAREVCRMTFANYFAGAVVLPYSEFAQAAKDQRHDVEKLAFQFDASVEQVCHRLSMLQRPGEKGIPFYFLRIDQAGNITKRHSATTLQFTRFGGGCPLWNVHHAFQSPGEILRQLAVTPDGVQYLSLAFVQTKRVAGFKSPVRKYAIGLGCEIKHAGHVVYADDMGTTDASNFDPIGTSCRICERTDCFHRSVPPIGKDIKVDHNTRGSVPFKIA
ncbi:short-chain fatty acyl-CoA regulator family protein [Loktanella sp. F6476L]|uniref:helix-turn-helix domain-containing protein n=1 Tax=Loktanella sp. F6476L TaxID=2926405 RepID=UPI001FF5B818|nr:helix-turn-helix transcriptional regulator [Loktanella sp. F6476L]MCK0119762.1 short-chain fatty acyl-CoA regulator family protein [Loktanella sp. F6476L]